MPQNFKDSRRRRIPRESAGITARSAGLPGARPSGPTSLQSKRSISKAFVSTHHYSGSFPAARLSVGLFRKQGPCAETRLVGVAVFSVPVQADAIRKYCGIAPEAGVELGRFVCLQDVAYNGETWFLSRAMRILAEEKRDIRSILSYADPMERFDGSGILTKPAHAGQIYQASNAMFAGRAKPRTLTIGPSGTVISERSFSKVRYEERGYAYAARQLIAAGVPEREQGESLPAWLDRVMSSGILRKVRHPGNYAYVLPLARDARRAASRAIGERLPYPKLAA